MAANVGRAIMEQLAGAGGAPAGGMPGGGMPPAGMPPGGMPGAAGPGLPDAGMGAEGPPAAMAEMDAMAAPQSREEARALVGQLIAQFGDAETALEELLVAGMEGAEEAPVEAEEEAAAANPVDNEQMAGGY